MNIKDLSAQDKHVSVNPHIYERLRTAAYKRNSKMGVFAYPAKKGE